MLPCLNILSRLVRRRHLGSSVVLLLIGAGLAAPNAARGVTALNIDGLAHSAIGSAALGLEVDGSLMVSGLGAVAGDGVSIALPGQHGPFVRVEVDPGPAASEYELYVAVAFPMGSGEPVGNVSVDTWKCNRRGGVCSSNDLVMGVNSDTGPLLSVRVRVFKDGLFVDDVLFPTPGLDTAMVTALFDTTAATPMDFGFDAGARRFVLRSVAPPGFDAMGAPLPAPALFSIALPGHELLTGNSVELWLDGIPDSPGPIERLDLRAVTPTSTLRVRRSGLIHDGFAIAGVDSALFVNETVAGMPWKRNIKVKEIGPTGNDGVDIDGRASGILDMDLTVEPVLGGAGPTEVGAGLSISYDKATPKLYEARIVSDGSGSSDLHVSYDATLAVTEVTVEVRSAGALVGSAVIPYSGGDVVLAQLLDDASGATLLSLLQSMRVEKKKEIDVLSLAWGVALPSPVQVILQGSLVVGDSVSLRAAVGAAVTLSETTVARVRGRNLKSLTLGSITGSSSAVTGVDTDGSIPTRAVALGNYPNPFNPRTTFTYTVPVAGDLALQIYDTRGRSVRTLSQGFFAPGEYSTTWDGRSNEGTSLASGVYFARLRSLAGTSVVKIVLAK
jgi:FlgD Ig-like domain